ncbi:MAG: UDP-N-acetylmuramate:L-alanyl-gamma-D-glutamyl-meso-diaminopimelate ligase [Gammaproteobacteria bacterium]|nr:UDP-N-acetylmuramate:L-alanyl-gamma-D-glutamyl-meso-diaminopimelate ligase [Gammaproteobacteria bacterium]MDH3750021.1 UDP-N-acetylmuramate:L-alanyl-gamma-D-glutamyl-meso-diaminopimelate ligase [Gammaproteobacteria bacterium]MDH3804026.1 UDP-N-acetylmuramate:L-alanyl-gamma-D-glutamyl-meso-diaminopimelate ligase [Gammaproteobacteria bacterium]
MHIHILGICGTFMGGVAALARAAGVDVTGCDSAVYPPMSTQLKDLGVEIHEGFDAKQLDAKPDCVVVGNVMSRGSEVVEAMLDRGIPYTSGPRWLADNVLRDRHVLAVAGTHGKTTAASMLAWILQDAGHAPGFLIGGIPTNFGMSASLGKSKYFVVEADEYDTAFFDKRAKFVHYGPRTLVLNNLEFDHADIFKDLDAIQWQFHQLLRTVPSSGRIIMNAADENLSELIKSGCWTPVETFASDNKADWTAKFMDAAERRIGIKTPGGLSGETRWKLGGRHNLENALAAVAAAQSADVTLEQSLDALSRFEGVKRRMERTATVGNIAIYDDFAHHPTAIRRTIAAMKRRYPGQRIVVAIEPRSNTMKLGVHNDTLAASLGEADIVWMYRPSDMSGEFESSLAPLGDRLRLFGDYDKLVSDMSAKVLSGDQVIFMSNGGFGSARQTLTAVLQRTRRS